MKSGDTLSSIARRYGTTAAQLKKWNSLRSNTLRVGQRLSYLARIRQAAPLHRARLTLSTAYP